MSTVNQKKQIFFAAFIGAVLPLFACQFAAAETQKNGFLLDDALIPAAEILAGGPPRDGIPSIDAPVFVAAAAAADFVGDEDLVLGVVVDGTARAYPINILNWHELVNDRIGDVPFVVTYCPLCGSGVVFLARAGKEELQFGVSGLLYNSDVLLYDRQSESLWSQLLRRAVSGKHRGARLKTIAAHHTTWRDWKNRHPKTQVLSTNTGHRRDYTKSPYGDYNRSETVYFPLSQNIPPDSYHPKEWVLGVESGAVAKAYPFVELNKNGAKIFADSVGGVELTIHWDAENWTARAESEKQATAKNDSSTPPPLESVRAFWFAWFAFHPQTEIFRAD